MRVSVHACERVCRDTQMHYWTVLPHASRNLEERAVGLGAPPPTQGSLENPCNLKIIVFY